MYPMSDDNIQEQLTSLVKRAQAGDKKAFDALFEQHRFSIYNHIQRRVQNYDLVQDLTQDTSKNAWRAVFQYRGDASFRTWLMKIADNVVNEYWRRRYHSLETVPLSKAYGVANPIRFEEYIEAGELINAALQEVPETYRYCLQLEIETNLSRQEIAERLGITTQTVSNYICKGYAYFRKAYCRLKFESDHVHKKGGIPHAR